ncbi:hypothetical protein [Streptomyces anulatus]
MAQAETSEVCGTFSARCALWSATTFWAQGAAAPDGASTESEK